MQKDFKETDMSHPIKQFFESKGYTVNSEVKNCDLTAIKGGELIVCEIKKSFNIKLLYQLIDRQKGADMVFAAIPRFSGRKHRDLSKITHILKSLNMGLITIAMDSPLKYVEVVLFPENIKTKKNKVKYEKILKELSGRHMDLNQAGSTKTKLMTAYREKSIKVLCVLEKLGECSPTILVKEYGFEKDVQSILSRNQYGWFEKKARGVYILSETGKLELKNPNFPEIVEYYRECCTP